MSQNGTTRYSIEPRVNKGPLPDLFQPPGRPRVTRREDWPAAAAAWRSLAVDVEYGGWPPTPVGIEVETLCHSAARRLPGAPNLWSYRIHCHGGARPFSFCVRALFPKADGAVPVIVNGDGCWWYLSDEVAGMVLERGCALVMFNRTELAEDLGYGGVPDKLKRRGGLYDVYPDHAFGALAAWAWGYHRVVDMLSRESFADMARIAVTGHSRGGKTTLLAGATDERIALVNDNASGAGGSAVYRYVGHGGETIGLVEAVPSWFGPKIRPFLNREDELPFDQHALAAAAAPRLMLSTYALDDRWSNPEGMVQSAWAAGEVFRFLGVSDRLAFHLRPGEHSHSSKDWAVLLDFIGRHWQGRPSTVEYNRHPYAHLRPAFAWKAPA